MEDKQGVMIDIDRFFRSEGVFLNIYDSPRSVSVRFLEVAWKDVNLRDKPPRLSSKRYSIVLSIIVDLSIDNYTLTKMGIGERLEPTNIDIIFYDKDTGMIQGSASRSSPRLTPVPKPPEELYAEGHAYIAKKRENSWILDVDAWFEMIIGQTTYYVKLNFGMTLEIKGLL